jgi:hypothetical protein
MNKSNQDWRVILNTNNYHSIFIKSSFNDESLGLFYKYINEISKIEDYSILLPTEQEKKDTSKYIAKFAPELKNFIEDNSKKTLISSENVINVLIKNEKRENFFRFLFKQKKNIIIFCESDYEKYVELIPSPYNFALFSHNDWENNIDIFDRFSDIKIAISETYNPFKNPFIAFKKYKEETQK